MLSMDGTTPGSDRVVWMFERPRPAFVNAFSITIEG
jgi:hypothetical protein